MSWRRPQKAQLRSSPRNDFAAGIGSGSGGRFYGDGYGCGRGEGDGSGHGGGERVLAPF